METIEQRPRPENRLSNGITENLGAGECIRYTGKWMEIVFEELLLLQFEVTKAKKKKKLKNRK